MKNKNEYNFDLKGKEIKKIFRTPEYEEYKEKKKKTQKKKEKIYKFTSIGNSTNAVRSLILINVILFIISYFIPLVTQYALYPVSSPNFMFYQVLTTMFLHGGLLHLVLNMIMLWSFGNQIENVIGTKKFLQLYFLSGLVSSLLWMFLGIGPAVGASGALSGLLAAYLFIAPEAKVMFFFVIPMKIKNLIYGFGAFSLVFGLLSLINPTFGFGVGHFAHLGGLIGGYLIANYWVKRNQIQTF